MPKKEPAAKRRRRRWLESEARAALVSMEKSGLSVAAFAAREGFAKQTLYGWRRRFGHTARNAGPAFVELPRLTPRMVEVQLRSSGHVLRVAESVDGRALRRLVDALEDVPTC